MDSKILNMIPENLREPLIDEIKELLSDKPKKAKKQNMQELVIRDTTSFDMFFNSPEWRETRIFSKAEALLDIILTIEKQRQGDHDVEFVHGKIIPIIKDEFNFSIRRLAARWHWGKDRVQSFLKNLKQRGIIRLYRNEAGQSLEVVN